MNTNKAKTNSGIKISISKKEAIDLIPITIEGELAGYVPKIKTPAGRTIMAHKDTRVMGLYNVIKSLFMSGKLERLNGNGTTKLDSKRNATYFDWNKFTELQEF